MGDAADDYYDSIMRQSENLGLMRANIMSDCPQWNCEARLFRNEDGFLECKQCGETFDD